MVICVMVAIPWFNTEITPTWICLSGLLSAINIPEKFPILGGFPLGGYPPNHLRQTQKKPPADDVQIPTAQESQPLGEASHTLPPSHLLMKNSTFTGRSSTVLENFFYMGVFINGGSPRAGWFIIENPIKTDDSWVPPFQETTI